jgi:hypothetical protein
MTLIRPDKVEKPDKAGYGFSDFSDMMVLRCLEAEVI